MDTLFFPRGTGVDTVIEMVEGKGDDADRKLQYCMSAGNPRVFGSVTGAELSKGSVEATLRTYQM